MRLKPLRGKILIKRVGDPEKIGHIIVPDTVKERPQKGIVLETNGVDDLEPGDAVLFQPWSDSWLFRLSVDSPHLAAITPKVVEAKILLRRGEATYSPYRSRVLIRPDKPPTVLRSGLYIHRTREEEIESTVGEVLAVGTGEEVKIGDRVVIPRQGGTTLGLVGIELFLLKEEEILGILEEAND